MQWVVRIVEKCWSSVNMYLLFFQRWEKDLRIPHRSDRQVEIRRVAGQARLTDEHLDKTDGGVVHARSV